MSVALERPEDGAWDVIRNNTDLTAKHLRPPMPNARVYRSSAHSAISTGTTGTLSWDAEDFDVGGMFDVSTPTRLTAPITGLYLAVGAGIMTTTVAGRVYPLIVKNGTSTSTRGTTLLSGAAEFNLSFPVRLERGDYVELALVNLSGNSITPNSGANSTWFSLIRLGGFTNEGVA